MRVRRAVVICSLSRPRRNRGACVSLNPRVCVYATGLPPTRKCKFVPKQTLFYFPRTFRFVGGFKNKKTPGRESKCEFGSAGVRDEWKQNECGALATAERQDVCISSCVARYIYQAGCKAHLLKSLLGMPTSIWHPS